MGQDTSFKDDGGDVTLTVPRAWLESALHPGVESVSADPVLLAQRILDDRNHRRALFPGVRLGEPSWDMMLHLFIADHHNETRFVSDMCVAAGVPTTTALSHLKRLVKQGYMGRRQDPVDRRRTYIFATDKLCTAMRGWLVWHRSWPEQLMQ